MLDRDSVNFKKAVFYTENAYFDGKVDEELYNKAIDFYVSVCKGIIASDNIEYSGSDREAALAQCAVFVFMTDSLPVQTPEGIYIHTPFEYNYEDYAGQKEWSNTFVSTLIATKKGNCHSMPYLYKLIMDELKQDAWLSMAPNHIYIKTRNQEAGWYNVELTCGGFPSDAWLMASGYIHMDAVRNGSYMDTLSLRQSVALCLVDLAQGFQRKYGTGDGTFILRCCDTALAHYPNYMNALLLKNDVLATLYHISEPDSEEKKECLARLTEATAHIHALGYRKMPEGMYMNWLNFLKERDAERKMSRLVKGKR